MSRYHRLFEEQKSKGQLAYIPFLLLGDPDFELSLKLIDTCVANGADGLEIGFAFSDPVADGPVIQQASLRPLANSFSVKDGFDLIRQIRVKYPELPIGVLTYANLVYVPGIERFYSQCQSAGVDSVLIADCPVQESALFSEYANKLGIQTVFIAPPDADEKTLSLIAKKSEGYTYVLSRKGITGTEVAAEQAQSNIIQQLKNLGSAPLVQGFGISLPEHVIDAKKAGVDGIITGSAIVKLINQHHQTPELMLKSVGDYVASIAKVAHE